MNRVQHITLSLFFSLFMMTFLQQAQAQMPVRYATLELFTNTPCPICGSQNPGLFSRLENYEGQYHLISFYPGTPYSSCIFYKANIPENTARLNFYTQIFGTPTVAINGTQFKSSSGVSTTVLDGVTGGESWLQVAVSETTGSNRTATITLDDFAGGSLGLGKLFAVVVEKEIMYNAPNGETLHHNVFRKFLTSTSGDDVDLTSGSVTKSYQYAVDGTWQADQVYVIAWLMDPTSKEIYNSGTRFDDVLSGTKDLQRNTLSIYPNPSSDAVRIALPEGIDAPLKVYNTQGQIVYEQASAMDTPVTIPTASWPVGTYQVEVVSDKAIWNGRFQIVR